MGCAPAIAGFSICLAVAACSGSAERTSWSDDQIVAFQIDWVNQTGEQLPESVASSRMDRICETDVWRFSESTALAQEFIDRPRDDAVLSIWVTARAICPERFPLGAIEAGPPSA